MTAWFLLSACVQEVTFVDTSEPEDTGRLLPCDVEPPDRELTLSQWEVDVGEVELGAPFTVSVSMSATGADHVTVTALEPAPGSEVTDLQLTGGCGTDGIVLSGCTATLSIGVTPQRTGHFIEAVRVHSNDPWREYQTVVITGWVAGELDRDVPTLHLRTDARATYDDELLELSVRAMDPAAQDLSYHWTVNQNGNPGDIEPIGASDATFSPSPVSRGECAVPATLYVLVTDVDGNQVWQFDELLVYRRPPTPKDRDHHYLGTCSTPENQGGAALGVIAALVLMMRRSKGRYVR